MYRNTQVTFDTDPNNARSESVIEANPLNPSNMAGASKRFTNLSTYEFSIAAYATFDAGRTWSEAPPLTLLEGWAGTSDPCLAWDSAGNAYLVALPFGAGAGTPMMGIAVYKSSDGGQSWGTPQLIHRSPSDDKQWAASDSNPASPHYGNIYIAWDNGRQLAFARSNDLGATWKGVGNQPVGTALALDSFAPVVSVAQDGTIYIVWVNGEEVGDTVKFVKSTNGGESFSSPQVIASGITPLKSPPLAKPGSFPELPGGAFRVLTLPDICNGSGGNVIAAWADFREGASRIYHRHSGDGGATWDGGVSGQPLLPAYLAPALNQHDFHPQLASTPSGQIACAFYEFGPKGSTGPSDSRQPSLIDVAIAFSYDGGATFSMRDTVTDRPWDPAINAPLSHGDPKTTFIGEYFGLAGSALGFFPLWTDTRTGMQELWTSAVSDLKTVWFGMLTDNSDDSGSDSSIVLIMNVRGGLFDALHHTIPDTAQSDQEQGQANLYEITAGDFEPQGVPEATVYPEELNASSIRIGIRGDDAWRPKSVFIWGEQKDGLIVPLALNTELQGEAGGGGLLAPVTLSTDPGEGKLSFAPLRVQPGAPTMIIRRLLMLLITADIDDAGTDDDIQLQITTSDGRLVVDHVFPDTPQSDLERAEANLYYVQVAVPFSKTELNENSIRLSIKGDDAWLPDRLFLFGLDEDETGPAAGFVVPLVHLPEWPLGTLSTDPEEGQGSVVLPLSM